VTSRSLDGLFVAVAMNGSVMTSVDGVTWVSQTAALSRSWSSVTARGTDGLFVAVAADGSVMTSVDGDLWVSQTAVSSSTWSSVRSCDTVFVAVATDGSVMTSADGVTWFARTAAEPNAWTSIACARGLRVVVSSDGSDRVMTSGALVRPVAPRITNTTVGDRTVTVTFSAGSDRVSGSPVATGFQYQLNGSGPWRTAGANSFTISRLINGTAYTVRVRGLNADGAGVPSKTVSVTPGVVPSSPGQPTLDSVTATSVTIHWVASTPKTGLPVISYTYSAYSVLGGATAVSYCNTTTQLSCTISGLSAGVKYTIKGIATNIIGDSATSKALGSVIPKAVPATPTITTVIAGTTARQAVVSWSATTANGSPVTNYTVTTFTTAGNAVNRGCRVNGTRTSCTVTALPVGGSYQFRLTSTNGVGISTEATYGPWTN